MREIFFQVKERALDPQRATDMNSATHIQPPFRHIANSPLKLADIAKAEAKLGFALPEAFKCMYLEIGNGNFGVAYGILPLLKGKFAATASCVVPTFLAWRKAGWKYQYLPFCYHGCTIFSLLDAKTGRVGIVDIGVFEDGFDEEYILWQKDSLEDWLAAWLAGEDLFFPLEEAHV